MKGLSHIGLRTSNLAQSERFYATVLGATLLNRREVPDVRMWLDVAGVRLEISEVPAWSALDELQQRAIPTVSFLVEPEEVDGLVTRLDAAGVPRHGPFLKATGSGVGVYFGDPDGNPLSLSCPEGYVRDWLIRNPASGWSPGPYDWPVMTTSAR